MVANIDWARGDLLHSLRVFKIDPFDLSNVRGEIRGIKGGSFELAYYGATRAGASLKLDSVSSVDSGSWLRIMHIVSDYTGVLLVEPLFTGAIVGAPWRDSGRDVTLSLKSALYALESTVAVSGYEITQGSKAFDVIKHLCGSQGREVRFTSAAGDYWFGSSVVYDPGTPYLEILNDVCNDSGNRVTVDGNGVIVIDRYIVPSRRGVDYSADMRARRGTVIGELSGDVQAYEVPTRVIVRAENGGASVQGVAEAQPGAFNSFDVRGYRLDRFERVFDVSPFTNDAARNQAEKLMANELSEAASIQHSLMYRPLDAGMIERLVNRDGSAARWMVSNATLDLSKFVWKLSLKGGYVDG